MEFEEFLKILGCKTGRHVFVKKAKSTVSWGVVFFRGIVGSLKEMLQDPVEELVKARVDHYQTLDKVHVSVFAKKVDASSSEVKFEDEKVGGRVTCLVRFDLDVPFSAGSSAAESPGWKEMRSIIRSVGRY